MMWTTVILALSGLTFLSQRTAACGIDYFECDNGECVLDIYGISCDRNTDCSDSSDEIGCYDCGSSDFTCDNGQCIYDYHRCDDVIECADGSDEVGCSTPSDGIAVGPIIGPTLAGGIIFTVMLIIFVFVGVHCRRRYYTTAVVVTQPVVPRVATTFISSQSTTTGHCVSASTSTYQPMVTLPPPQPTHIIL